MSRIGELSGHPPNGDASLEDNTASFTRFASLLFIDSRSAGFSYDLGVEGSGCPGIDDAVDHVRVVLRHLAMHPERRRQRVVLLGESWGGTRAIAMSHLLRHPEDAHDDAFAREVHEHFEAVAPITADDQFGELVLIQPLVETLPEAGARMSCGAARSDSGMRLMRSSRQWRVRPGKKPAARTPLI